VEEDIIFVDNKKLKVKIKMEISGNIFYLIFDYINEFRNE